MRRLKDLEERILESEAWNEHEPLYSLMESEANLSTLNGHSSPRKALSFISSQPAIFYGEVVQAPSCLQLSSNDPTQATKLSLLELFFRKLYRLVHLRLTNLCAALQLNDEIVHKCWDVIVNTLENEHRTRALYRRHVDQLIMCSIYGISKVMDVPLTFKDIVCHYRSQPQCMESVRTMQISKLSG